MKNPYINSLSANNQFNNIEQVTDTFEDFIKTLYHLHPAVISQRIMICYDEQIESRSLIPGQTFNETINGVRRTSAGKDTIAKWYLFIKKYSHVSSNEISESKLESNLQSTYGHACSNITSKTTSLLLSIGGSDLTESKILTLSNEHGSIAVPNAYSITSLLPLIPCYEPSDKHKTKPYMSARGEHVAAMPLSAEEAQNLLLQSIKYGKDYWGFHQVKKEYYRFKPTHPDRLIYHGFKIEEHEIPIQCLEKLKP